MPGSVLESSLSNPRALKQPRTPAGAFPLDPDSRRHFLPDGALVRNRLVEIDDGDRPLLTRALRVPDRVVEYLLGSSAEEAIALAVTCEEAAAAFYEGHAGKFQGRQREIVDMLIAEEKAHLSQLWELLQTYPKASS